MTKANKFFVTTPIYYINDVPHIGHAYSTIAADVLARHYRAKLEDKAVLFSTGTDENSKKTLEAAEVANKNVADYTDAMAEKWRAIWDKLDISYDRFIRTSQPDHVRTVDAFVEQIRHDITKGVYEGLYCYRCEAFYKDSEIVEGKCPTHKIELESVREENYFFDLPKYTQKLIDWIKSEACPVRPEARKNEVLAFIERGLEPISISRAHQEIGLPLAWDSEHKIYVWVEALINYLTVAGYPKGDWQAWWENVCHIVGKDIIKFHCIIWPAMLMSAGIEPPWLVFAHGFFTIDGEKISKSLGNAVDPLELAEIYGNDALRYYLLREIPFGSDGDFSHERFAAVYNADLANDLGNLVQRVASMLGRYNEGKYDEVKPAPLTVEEQIEGLAFDRALEAIFERIRQQNVYLEQQQPWAKAKSEPAETVKILSRVASEIVQIGQALRPLLPDTAAKIAQTFAGGNVNPKVGILFPKKEH